MYSFAKSEKVSFFKLNTQSGVKGWVMTNGDGGHSRIVWIQICPQNFTFLAQYPVQYLLLPYNYKLV